jgi:HEAT repeat protein
MSVLPHRSRGARPSRWRHGGRSAATPGRQRLHACICAVTFTLLVLPLATGAEEPEAMTNWRDATFEQLVLSAQRYGSTAEKRERREAAREELFARGTNALQFLMAHVHIENEQIQFLIAEMIRKRMDADVVAPVLVAFLDVPEARTRRVAAFYLGFTDANRYAGQIMPLLDDEETVAAAARTLGRWGVTAALPRLVALLHDEKERRRIEAVNALYRLGGPEAIAALITALDDPVFTVRKAAARGLVAIGNDAERPVLDALPTSRGVARRELVRVLGQMAAKHAVKPLRRLLKSADDAGLRRDIADALAAIDPKHADKWLR